MKKYYRLTFEEREEISRLLSQNYSFNAIAGCLERDKSTICREINGGGANKYLYRAITAQNRARRKASKRRKGKRKLDKNRKLKQLVKRKLKLKWSPEQIVSFLKREYPQDKDMRISHEAIYTYLNREAETIRKSFAKEVKRLPKQMFLTLTYDQGREMAEHKLFTKETKAMVYFAHPGSPWERGTNENTNGLIRQFFPKGTDFNKINRKQIKKVQHLLNGRPRKTLDWQTPYEVFNKLLRFHGHGVMGSTLFIRDSNK